MRKEILIAWLVLSPTWAAAETAKEKATQAVIQGAVAISSANVCNFSVDQNALTRYFQGQFGSGTLDEVAFAHSMVLVLAMESLVIASLSNKPPSEVRDFCQQQFLTFGPTGTKIPGILAPH